MAEFTVKEGAEVPVHAGLASFDRASPRPVSTPRERSTTPTAWWRDWSEPLPSRTCGRTEAVLRSLITLKALTYAPTGGIVAARDHLAARAARRGAQLGLSLLLAPRRDVHPAGPGRAPAISTRRATGATGCSAPWRAGPKTSRSCTAWPASAG